VHNLPLEHSPSAAVRNSDAEMSILIYDLLFLTHFFQSTPIYCGAVSVSTNAYFLGKHVLPVEKCAAFAW
jgi:hypothetical protein